MEDTATQTELLSVRLLSPDAAEYTLRYDQRSVDGFERGRVHIGGNLIPISTQMSRLVLQRTLVEPDCIIPTENFKTAHGKLSPHSLSKAVDSLNAILSPFVKYSPLHKDIEVRKNGQRKRRVLNGIELRTDGRQLQNRDDAYEVVQRIQNIPTMQMSSGASKWLERMRTGTLKGVANRLTPMEAVIAHIIFEHSGMEVSFSDIVRRAGAEMSSQGFVPDEQAIAKSIGSLFARLKETSASGVIGFRLHVENDRSQTGMFRWAGSDRKRLSSS